MDVERRHRSQYPTALSAAFLFLSFSLVPAIARGDEPMPSPNPIPPPPPPPIGAQSQPQPSAASTAAPPGSAPAQPAAPATPSLRTAKPSENVGNDALYRIIDRPHTVAELEAGIIALPSAPISARQGGGDTPIGRVGRGDATMQIGIHVLYRWSRSFEIGAGALFAPAPTSDDEYGGLRALPRTHSRSYFFLGTEGRWIPVHYKFAEAWVGVSIGGVVVADRFSTEAGDQVPTILGTHDVTVRTEGFAAGIQGGGNYYFSENWIGGASLRAYNWILPDTPRCSSIGDCASLSGTVLALELGLLIGYRLPL